MAQKVDHIGILVGNLDEALKLYKDCFGAQVDRIETVPEQGVKAAVLSLGQGAKLELLEPLPDSNMAKVLEKRGFGGFGDARNSGWNIGGRKGCFCTCPGWLKK